MSQIVYPVLVTAPVGIGERKRRAVRAELSDVALELLIDRDFESVTVDEIASAVGVSRRTFFRYFASKEDVVFAFLDQWRTSASSSTRRWQRSKANWTYSARIDRSGNDAPARQPLACSTFRRTAGPTSAAKRRSCVSTSPSNQRMKVSMPYTRASSVS